ncbi:glycosyltransferase family 2 protein [Sporolactobacillus kofuensis]|uniref:Glycosyltransferase family 2 protein n=1 Tax=Sporolactobacillus kofuensis TaxID=269672 RepID=A0ABW1WED3_9BACL|nr:glycosyltransferase [Sporolactobacillus kofuensis]
MNHPLVSVIILTYNNFHYLEQSIDSVLSQNYSNIELIISDDGSKNFNKTFVENYLSENLNENIKDYSVIQNKKNLGIVKNFNNSIKISNGEYIVPLDCDDCFYDENVIRSLVKEFLNTGANIITGYMDEYDQSLKTFIQRSPNKSKLILFNNMDQLFEELCRRNFIAGACTSYSRKLFDKYGFLDESYTFLNDYPEFLRLARLGEQIYFIHTTIIKYRLGGISTGKVINPAFEKDVNLVLRKEILPYREKISPRLYRVKMYDYLRRTEKKVNLLLLSIKYFDVVVIKVMDRLKSFVGKYFVHKY